MTGGVKRTAGLFAKKPSLKVALLAGAALVLPLALPTVSASADTLQEALSLAYQGNPNLLAARAQLRATDEAVPQALSGWRPTLSVSGEVNNNHTDNITYAGVGPAQVVTDALSNRFQQGATAQFTQPIFRGFKTWAGTSQAKNQVYAQRARLAATEANVLLLAATAYFDVVQNQAVLDLNINNVQVLQRQLEATQDRFRVGELTRTDVAQAEAGLAGAKAQQVQSEGALQQSRSAYDNVVGKDPENLSMPALPPTIPASFDDVITMAIANNPNFIAADFTAKAADDNITVTRGNLLPSINVIGQYSKAWNTLADKSKQDVVIAEAQVVVPIYQSGSEYSFLRQAKQVAGQQHFVADQARLDARNTATQAWENYQATTASIESFKTQINANEIALEGTQRESEVGSKTVLDVLNAEQLLLTSRVSLVRAQHDQFVAAYQLLASLGTLTGEGVGLSGPMYDPVANYKSVEYQAFGSHADQVKAPAATPVH